MIKRTSAILFILLANIILLAHAVIPHHHHKEQVCIENAHCQNDSLAHKHNTPEHNHNHDGKNISEYCVLKQAVIVPSNLVKPECKWLGFIDKQFPSNDFLAVLFKNELNSFLPISVSKAQILLITSSYPHFLHCSLGLRAPPTV